MPPYRSGRSDRLAFVIVEEHYLKYAVMYFKVLMFFFYKESSTLTLINQFGLSRLQLPELVSGLQIWDRPTPLDLQCCILSVYILRFARFYTIVL